MLINESTLRTVFAAFNASYTAAFDDAQTNWQRIATKTASGTREEEYGWIGQHAGLREWLGDRVVNKLKIDGFRIKNKKFEYTIEVERDDFADDRYGVFGPLFRQMGAMAAQHPDELAFGLLGQGFAQPAYDGQNFFDTDHPVIDADGAEQGVSNFVGGAGSAWFLIDGSKPIKPLIWQEREPYRMQRLDKENDEHVFLRDKYLYGVRARGNVGFGAWQLAYASKQPLTADNYAAARAAMARITADGGRRLRIMADTLVVPPELEKAGRQLLNRGSRIENADDGSGAITPVAVTNEWQGTAELIVTPYLDA